MKIIYTAEATVQGGRQGEGRTSDGKLEVKLRTPKELGMGGSTDGTNPEQLFALGYAACFQSALALVGQREKVDTSQSTITSRVGLGANGQGGFALEVELLIFLPGVDTATGEKLIEITHQVCPYSNATRGNIPVKLTLAKQPLTSL